MKDDQSNQKTFNVSLHQVVRVKYSNVAANSQEEAIEKALKAFEESGVPENCFNKAFYISDAEKAQLEYIEDAQETVCVLVDERGDDNFLNSNWYHCHDGWKLGSDPRVVVLHDNKELIHVAADSGVDVMHLDVGDILDYPERFEDLVNQPTTMEKVMHLLSNDEQNIVIMNRLDAAIKYDGEEYLLEDHAGNQVALGQFDDFYRARDFVITNLFSLNEWNSAIATEEYALWAFKKASDIADRPQGFTIDDFHVENQMSVNKLD